MKKLGYYIIVLFILILGWSSTYRPPYTTTQNIQGVVTQIKIACKGNKDCEEQLWNDYINQWCLVLNKKPCL